MSTAEAFDDVLKRARLAEAAHLDALEQIKDARTLRLQALRATIMPKLLGYADATTFLDLAVQPGETPRLWIDLISSVVVEPDTRNFRLQQEQDGSRVTLHEAADVDEMAGYVLRLIAHRVIAKQRATAAATRGPFLKEAGYSLGAMIYVWFTGLALGVLSLLIIAIALKILKI